MPWNHTRDKRAKWYVKENGINSQFEHRRVQRWIEMRHRHIYTSFIINLNWLLSFLCNKQKYLIKIERARSFSFMNVSYQMCDVCFQAKIVANDWNQEMQRLRSQWFTVFNPEKSKKGALSTPWIVFVNSIVCFNSVHYFYWLHTFFNCALLLLHAKQEPNKEWADHSVQSERCDILFFIRFNGCYSSVSKCAIEFVIFETFDHLNSNLAQYSIQN